MANLKPMFSLTTVFKQIDNFAEAKIQKSIETLQYVGEDFVNRARSTKTYTDRTGNLRSSIGYVIVYNGKIKQTKVEAAERDENGSGVKNAKEKAKEFALQYSKDLILVVFAGMEYAAAVESLGYDVISGSQPMASTLLNELKQELA